MVSVRKTLRTKGGNKMLKYIKDYFKDWNLFEKIWLLAFSIINIYLFFAWNDTIIGLTASLTGMICVVLVAKGKISNYYFGIVNVVLYAYIAWQSKYYGEVMLNALYFLPVQFVGLYYWRINVDRRKTWDDVKIKFLSFTERWAWLLASALGTFFYGLLLKYLGGTLPFVDSSTTVLSVVAMLLMIKRVTEQWILWIAIDVVSIYMWFYILAQGGNEISMLVMWSAYLVNAVYGFYNWIRMGKNDTG